MNRAIFGFASIFALFYHTTNSFAELQLYDTGPKEESSYVRFVNATEEKITVLASNGGAKVELGEKGEGRVSKFFQVKSELKLSATIRGRVASVLAEATGKPWEYVTIVVLPSGDSQIKTALVRENPKDFNAMRSSVALFNLDQRCGKAAMSGGQKGTVILDGVEPFSVQRRLINPVKLAAAVGCGGLSSNRAVELFQLQPGGRYSVFLVALKNGGEAFVVRDAN